MYAALQGGRWRHCSLWSLTGLVRIAATATRRHLGRAEKKPQRNGDFTTRAWKQGPRYEAIQLLLLLYWAAEIWVAFTWTIYCARKKHAKAASSFVVEFSCHTILL